MERAFQTETQSVMPGKLPLILKGTTIDTYGLTSAKKLISGQLLCYFISFYHV